MQSVAYNKTNKHILPLAIHTFLKNEITRTLMTVPDCFYVWLFEATLLCTEMEPVPQVTDGQTRSHTLPGLLSLLWVEAASQMICCMLMDWLIKTSDGLYLWLHTNQLHFTLLNQDIPSFFSFTH